MADLAPGTVLGNRFEVVGILGYGGMATVYLVRDRLREEEVALKVLHDHLARSASMRARLRREVRTAARLSSPHALVAWDLHDLDGHLALSMPVHRGVTLAEHVQQRGPLDAPSLVRLAGELAAALGEAHRLGIVHRDVTPPNVLLDPAGRSVLTDFGLARSATQTTMTSTAVLGTAGYAAPEVYQGVRTDPRSDLYSLGAVLYFAATGAPPFAAPDPMGVLRKQLSGEFVPLAMARPDLPVELAATIDQLLAYDVHDRPAEAATVTRRLEGRAARRVVTSLRWGTWSVELEATKSADPRALAKAFAAAAGHSEDVLPSAPALHDQRFTLVVGIDRPTALRLAEAAGVAGYVASVVDVTPSSAHRPPLSAVLGSAFASAAVGVGGGAVLFVILAVSAWLGPWVTLPYWAPPGDVVTTALLIVGGLAASWLGPVGALSGIVHTLASRRRATEIVGPVFDDWSREGVVGLAWLFGTALAAIPAGALLVAMYLLTFQLPPIVMLPPGSPITGASLEGAVLLAGAVVTMLGLGAASFASWATASAWQAQRAPILRTAFQPTIDATPMVRAGASVIERVQAELLALEGAISRASDRLPAAAAIDLRSTVRELAREVAALAPRVVGLQEELRRLDEAGAAAEAERLEVRLARARTLARSGGEVPDLGSLDRALAAHLDTLAQADVAEDQLTALTARLLEVVSLTTRCRFELLSDEGSADRALDLAGRLGSDLTEVRRAVAESGGVPAPTPTSVAPRIRVPQLS